MCMQVFWQCVCFSSNLRVVVFFVVVFFFSILQIVALREQNAHIQRKVASGDGGEDILEGSEAQQKVHGKVSLPDDKMESVF